MGLIVSDIGHDPLRVADMFQYLFKIFLLKVICSPFPRVPDLDLFPGREQEHQPVRIAATKGSELNAALGRNLAGPSEL